MDTYIYIDDIRTNDSFYRTLIGDWAPFICRDYQESIDVITQHAQAGDRIILDLDHDLGFDDDDDDVELNGYDICRYIVESNLPIYAFHIHSMNPVGAANMRQLLSHYGIPEI